MLFKIRKLIVQQYLIATSAKLAVKSSCAILLPRGWHLHGVQPQDKVLRALFRDSCIITWVFIWRGGSRREDSASGMRTPGWQVDPCIERGRGWNSPPAEERELSRGKAWRFAAWRLPAAGLSAGFSRNYSSGENCRRRAARASSSLSASSGTLARFTLLLDASSRIFFSHKKTGTLDDRRAAGEGEGVVDRRASS